MEALEEDLRLAKEKEDMLLNELMQKEKAIELKEQLKSQHHKEIRNIQQSRTWRFTAPFRAFIPRYRKRIKE